MVTVERTLMTIGLALLAVWGAKTVQSAVLSRVAVAAFEEQTIAGPASRDASIGEKSSPAEVDFSSWSAQRIQAFKHSVEESFGVPIAVLRIPAVHLEVPVLDGSDDAALNRGVGRIPGTAQLGTVGNLGIAGHRDGFFRTLKDVKQGDVVELVQPRQTDLYVINAIRIVDPSDVSVLAAMPASSLTLVTCYPFYFVGSAPQRYVVSAVLKGSRRANLSFFQDSDSTRTGLEKREKENEQ